MSFEKPNFENMLSDADKKIEPAQTEQERKLPERCGYATREVG